MNWTFEVDQIQLSKRFEKCQSNGYFHCVSRIYLEKELETMACAEEKEKEIALSQSESIEVQSEGDTVR